MTFLLFLMLLAKSHPAYYPAAPYYQPAPWTYTAPVGLSTSSQPMQRAPGGPSACVPVMQGKYLTQACP